MSARIDGASTGIGFGVSGTVKKNSSDTSEMFSQILEKMKKGESPSLGAGSDDASDEDAVTVTRILSDGSTLITTMKDGKIVSQTKTHAAVQEESPKLLDTVVEKGIWKAEETETAEAVASSMAANSGNDILGLLNTK